MKVYVGLDCATVGGVAFYNPTEHAALVSEIRGNPLHQLIRINELIKLATKPLQANNMVFVFEMLVHFRNARTVRSLSERNGFLRYSLQGSGFKTYDIDPNVARAFLGSKNKVGTFDFLSQFYKGKYLTNNHTDALAVALYQANADGFELNFDSLKIERIVE